MKKVPHINTSLCFEVVDVKRKQRVKNQKFLLKKVKIKFKGSQRWMTRMLMTRSRNLQESYQALSRSWRTFQEIQEPKMQKKIEKLTLGFEPQPSHTVTTSSTTALYRN